MPGGASPEKALELTTCAYHTGGIPGLIDKIARDFEKIRR
jgi:hypothetical protein